MRNLASSIITAIIVLSGSTALGQWQLISPPKPGAITSIGVAGGNPDNVYVSSDPDGAWQTADGGQTNLIWLFADTSVNGLFQVHSTRVAFAPSNNLIRYLLDVGGTTRVTTDGGLNWNYGGCAGRFHHNNRPWTALAIHPGNPAKVLAGGKAAISGLHLQNVCACPPQSGCPPTCTSCGTTPAWICACGVPPDVVVTDIEWVVNGVLPTVWASTSDCSIHEEHPGDCAGNFVGVLVSVDDGQNWATKSIGLPGDLKNKVYAVATIPGADAYCLAATADGLWGTVDGGNNWADYTPLGLSNRLISDVVFLQTGVVYIGTTQGVYYGVASGPGINWSTTAFPVDSVTSLGAAYSSPARLYVGYDSGSIYKTLNNGVNVNPINGAHGTYPIATIGIKSSNDQIAYFGTVCQQGIFAGTIPTATTPSWRVLAFPGNPWAQHFHYVMRVKTDPVNANTLYATDNDIVWKNTSSGATPNWIPVLFSEHLHGLAVAPSNPLRLYAGSGFGIWGTGTSNLRVYRSDDAGVTWPGVSTIITASSTSLYDIAVSPQNPDVVYVATFGHENYPDPAYGSGHGVYRTLDGGVTWSNASFNLTGTSLFVGEVAMRVRAGQLHIYIATLNGVYRMTGQSGTNWTDITPMTPSGSRRFEAIAIHPVNNNLMYTGTVAPLLAGSAVPAEIYQSSNGGTSWQQMTIAMEPRAWANQYRVRDIQVSPTRAYAAVEGSGVYMLDIPPQPAPIAPIGP